MRTIALELAQAADQAAISPWAAILALALLLAGAATGRLQRRTSGPRP